MVVLPGRLCFYVFMRTTVDLPDDLFREAKAAAAHRGISLKTLIGNAIEHEVRHPRLALNRRVRLPLVTSKRPGRLCITNAEIEEILGGSS